MGQVILELMRTGAEQSATVARPSEQNRHRLVNLLVAVGLSSLEVVILKVRVVARLLGGDAASGIVDEHHFKQVQANIVEIMAERRRHVTIPLGE